MRKILFFCISLLFTQILHGENEKIRQIFLIRHAETNPDGSLSNKGKERAKTLAKLLQKQKISEIIVSRYERTRETAKELAKQKNINPKILTMTHEIKYFIHGKKEESDNIVVVSHSDIMTFVAFELRTPSIQVRHDDFSNLFIITLEGNKFKGMSSLVY